MTRETVTTGLGELGPIRHDASKTIPNTALHIVMGREAEYLAAIGQRENAAFIRRAMYAIGEASADRMMRDLKE